MCSLSSPLLPSLTNCSITVPDWLSYIFSSPSLDLLYQRLDLTNLRHALYLISPHETSFPKLEQVPNYNPQVCVWWMLLISVELTLLCLFGHSDRFALNDSMCSIFAGMLSQCFKFGGRAVAIFGYVWVWDNFRLIELPWDSPWTWILCFLTQDLAYYFGHRAIHEAGFFWGVHTIHHSSEYFNLSISMRQAAIQVQDPHQFSTDSLSETDAGLAFHDILQAFFIPPPIFLVHRYFSEIFQFWMHTSLLGTLGPMGLVFNTPSHHRVHHGRNAYCIDRNYGGVLIIWDRMFGTFEAERREEPPVYGLIHPERSFNELWLQFHSLKELLCDKWRMKDEKGQSVFPKWTDKLKALLFPPAWLPGAKVRLFFHWASLDDHTFGVPPIELPVQKYNPPIGRWLKAYCLAHLLLLLCMFLHFEQDRNKLGYLDFSLKLAFFVCTMQSFGAFFDKKLGKRYFPVCLHFAPFLELFRSLGVIAYYAVPAIVQRKSIFDPYIIFMTAPFVASAIVWTAVLLKTFIVCLHSSKFKVRKGSKVTLIVRDGAEFAAEPIGVVCTQFGGNGENGEKHRRDKEERQTLHFLMHCIGELRNQLNKMLRTTMLKPTNWRINNYAGISLLFFTIIRILRPINYLANNKEQLIVLISAVYSIKSRLYADNQIVLLIIAPQGQQIEHTEMVAKSNNGSDRLHAKFAFRQASPTLNMCHWLAYIAVFDSVVQPQVLHIGRYRHKMANVEIQRPYLKKRVQVGACFSPLFFMEHWQIIVFSIEIYRHFGVSLQIIYLMSAIEGIFEILKEYKAKDVIQIEPWYTINLEGQQFNGSVNNPNLEMEWRSQATAHTDCLLKYGYAAEFLIAGDFDDLLVPDHGTYYDEFVRITKPNTVALVYNRLHTELTTTRNPKKFSLLDTLMSGNVSPNIPLLQKSVSNTSLTESLWIHLPYILKPFAVFTEVPTHKGRMFHIREWHFLDEGQIARSAAKAGVALNAYINSTAAQRINQRFEKTIRKRKNDTFHQLPTQMHYAQQFVRCYREVEEAQNRNILKECPGPHRCSIKPIIGLKCVISKRTFSGNKLAPGMVLYTSPIKENFQISDSGCSF